MRRSFAGLLTVLAVVAAACSGGGHLVERSSPESDPPASSNGQAAGQAAHAIGVTFQYEAFAITLGQAVYDETSQQLFVGVRYRNLGATWMQPNPVAYLRMGGQDFFITVPITMLPPGASTDLATSVRVESDPFADGSGAAIVWGKDGDNRPVVDLAARTVDNGALPIDVPVDAWGHDGRYTVHVIGGHVQSGARGRVAAAPAGERVLRLDFDVYTARHAPFWGFAPEQHLMLTRPDGSTVEAIPSDSSEARDPLSWTSFGGNWIEFPVKEPVDGDYSLLLTGPVPIFAQHPELIVPVPIPLHIQVPEAPASTDAGGPLPEPVLDQSPSGSVAAVGKVLDVGSINVPGFTVTPKHVGWDAASAKLTIDGEVMYIQTETDTASPDANPAAGVLSAPPQFSASVALLNGSTMYAGTATSGQILDKTTSVPITLEFENVPRFDLDSAVLYLGPSGAAASTLPLGDAAPIAPYPASIAEGPVEAPPVSSGEWTVALRSYRLGRFTTIPVAPPGELDLEVLFDVTVAPNANVPSLGLWFNPSHKVFLSGPDGYLAQSFASSGSGNFQPGQSQRLSVIFHVPDTFSPGLLGFVLRSGDEAEDFATTEFTEVTFGAQIGAPTPTVTAG